MLLKENDAPKRKKRANQKPKVSRRVTPSNNFERVFPVSMHLETDDPNRYKQTAKLGANFHFSP
jgi:hypothetical protein